jgi:hypothetical protein
VCKYHVEPGGTPYNYTFYWDKETGMHLYYENSGIVPVIFTAAYNYTVIWELVESSYESVYVPELTGPVMLLVFIAITVSIDICRLKRKHT